MQTEEDIRVFFHTFDVCREIHFCNCCIFTAIAHFYQQMFVCCVVAGELEVVFSNSNIIEALVLVLPFYSNVCLLFILI